MCSVRAGVLAVVRSNVAQDRPYTGLTEIRSGEVAEDLASYLVDSEQVRLGWFLIWLFCQEVKGCINGIEAKAISQQMVSGAAGYVLRCHAATLTPDSGRRSGGGSKNEPALEGTIPTHHRFAQASSA